MKNKKIVVIIILCFVLICSISNKTLSMVRKKQSTNLLYDDDFKISEKYKKIKVFDEYFAITFFTSVSFVSIGYILWFKYGKDRKIIETIELYPPNEYNSAEINFII